MAPDLIPAGRVEQRPGDRVILPPSIQENSDVERHDLVALALEFLGAAGETATDFVLDVAQAFARADLGFLGHRSSLEWTAEE